MTNLDHDASTIDDPAVASSHASRDALHDELKAIVAVRATVDGCINSLQPGVRYYRMSEPCTFRKTMTVGPTFTVVVQGRKMATVDGITLSYDPQRYLVITGEAELEGSVLEASRERPYLAVCMDIPADVVAKTLLALAEADAEPTDAAAKSTGDESVPAFVADLDGPMQSGVVRFLRAIDDPIERQFVAPLVMEELVFRLLRTDAAAVIRATVRKDRDAETIARAMDFIRSHVSRALSVEDVARHVAMSPSHFAHRFRAIARVSPMRYLKQVRLTGARELMIGSGLRVAEAASKVGYESPSHFTRDFRKQFGSSPVEYVRRFRQA